MNNRFLYGFVAALAIVSIVGCSSVLSNNDGVFGKSSKGFAKVEANILHVENAQAQANEEALAHIGAYAKGGVEHALNKIPETNVTREVVVAKQMNERVEALAGKPDFKEVEAIKAIVDQLTSEIATVRADGDKSLAAKDKEITKLENKIKDLNIQREEGIANAMAQANANARKTDQLTATLGQMDSWFGLGAVFYGAKKFIVSMAWILGIGSIIFLLLRAFAATNPIVASIFAVFERMFSWVINTVKVIAPRSTAVAGFTETRTFNDYKSTLHKIIDAIETVKDRQAAVVKVNNGSTPPVSAQSVVADILTEASKSMNEGDKQRIADAKKEMLW